MKSIKEYVKTLSSNEREQQKELIEECLQREKELRESYNRIQEGLCKMIDSYSKVTKIIEQLPQTLETLNRTSKILESTKAYLEFKKEGRKFDA